MEADRRICVDYLAEKYMVSTWTIHHVLIDDFGLSKKSARWVPKLLTDEQKDVRIQCSKEFLDRYKRDPDNSMTVREHRDRTADSKVDSTIDHSPLYLQVCGGGRGTFNLKKKQFIKPCNLLNYSNFR